MILEANMEKYKAPKSELLEFKTVDVITTSGPTFTEPHEGDVIPEAWLD